METGALAVRATGLQTVATVRTPNRVALLGFAVRRVLLAEAAVLAEVQLVRRILLVLGRRVVALLALGAGEGHDIAHRLSLHPLPARRGLFVVDLITG